MGDTCTWPRCQLTSAVGCQGVCKKRTPSEWAKLTVEQMEEAAKKVREARDD